MFLRSLLQRKNKKDDDHRKSPQKEDGEKADGIELGVTLQTDNLDGCSTVTNEDTESVLVSTAGCRDQVNSEEVTHSQNDNQACTSTQQTPPGPPDEEMEFLTPPSGSREPKTSSKKLFEGLVGQQGDGDYVEETPAKSLNRQTDEQARSSIYTSNFDDECLIDSDPEIDELIQDVLTIVSRELMNEHSNLQDKNTSQVKIGSGKYFNPSNKSNCQTHPISNGSELGKTASSMISKEKHFRRHPFKAKSKNGISSVSFDFKNAVSPLDPLCDTKKPEDDTKDNLLQYMKEDQGRHDINDQKDLEDDCYQITGGDEIPSYGANKSAQTDGSLLKIISDHNKVASLASVTEASQDPVIKIEQLEPSFKDVKKEVQISVLHQGVTDARSKNRIGNVLACRFEENNGLNLPSPASSDARFEKTDRDQFCVTSEKNGPDYEASSIIIKDSVDQKASTDATILQNSVNYYVTDPTHEISDSSYDVRDVSYDVTDLSYEINSETDWSKFTDYCEQGDTTYDDDDDAFLPNSLEDFVIMPCEDSDTEDGDDFSLEETPRDKYVVKDGSRQAFTISGKEGPRKDESQNREEEDDDSDQEMRERITSISENLVNGSLDDKALDLTSSPTDESPPRRQSEEDNLEDMEKWVHLRRRYMEKGLKCLLGKLQPRAEKVESSLKKKTSEFKEKVLESIEKEVEDLEEDELTASEDVGEMFLMDNLLKSVYDQQELLLSSLRSTEERTSLMEMQLEQWEVGEEDRKQQIVSLREEVEGATARQRSLSAMLNEERRLKEALQLRLATLTQEKQQLLYNNVILWEQTSQMELKQEHFQSVSAHERNELEEQMKALESELLELRSRKAGEPVKQISSESSCSVTSDQHQRATTSKPENDGGGFAQSDHMAPHNGPQVTYGTPPQHYGNDVEYYAPVPYHYYHGQQRPNANNSGFPFAPPRFPPPFPRRSRPRRGRGDSRSLRAYFDRLSPFYPPTWYPNQPREQVPSPRGRGGRPFRGRGFSRRGRGRGFVRDRRGNFKGEHRN